MTCTETQPPTILQYLDDIKIVNVFTGVKSESKQGN